LNHWFKLQQNHSSLNINTDYSIVLGEMSNLMNEWKNYKRCTYVTKKRKNSQSKIKQNVAILLVSYLGKALSPKFCTGCQICNCPSSYARCFNMEESCIVNLYSIDLLPYKYSMTLLKHVPSLLQPWYARSLQAHSVCVF
jgi:hypothetical protein